MPKIALAAASFLALAACDGMIGDAAPGGNASDWLSNEPPSYGAATPEQRALAGCASGRTADLLHQNRPGGSDFSATRCSADGY